MTTRVLGVLATVVLLVAGCAQVSTSSVPSIGSSRQAPVSTAALPSAPTQGADESTPPVDLGPTPADEAIAFNVSLRLPGEADMTAYIAGLTQPGSPTFEKYLTPDQFGARFGLSDAEMANVVEWLRAAGLTATTTPQRTSIAVQGTASQVDSLLGVTLADRQNASGVRYHVPVGEPRIPAALKDSVETVVGLDTEPVQRPALGTIFQSGVPDPGLTPELVSS